MIILKYLWLNSVVNPIVHALHSNLNYVNNYSHLCACTCIPPAGLCAVDVTVPESGSIVVGAVNKANITLFCRLNVNGSLPAVTWLIADEGVDVSSATAININSAGFAFSGETVGIAQRMKM